jgi:hypothetical protein
MNSSLVIVIYNMSLFQPDQRDSFVPQNPLILVHEAIILENHTDSLIIQSVVNPDSISTVPKKLVTYNGEHYDNSLLVPNTLLKVFINIPGQFIERIELADTFIYTVIIESVQGSHITGKYAYKETEVNIKIPIDKIKSNSLQVSLMEGDELKLYKTRDKFSMVELKSQYQEEDKVEEESKAVGPRASLGSSSQGSAKLYESPNKSPISNKEGSLSRESRGNRSFGESVDRSMSVREEQGYFKSLSFNAEKMSIGQKEEISPLERDSKVVSPSYRQSEVSSRESFSQASQGKELLERPEKLPVFKKDEPSFSSINLDINNPVKSLPPNQFSSFSSIPLNIMSSSINTSAKRGRPSIDSLLEEKLLTIGKERLPIESLQLVYKYNESFVEYAKAISKSYSSWRRVRGDGNCYYRAIGVALLEHFCRFTTPFDELELFIYKLENDHAYRGRDIDHYFRQAFVKNLKKLLQIKRNSEPAIEVLQSYLADEKFDYSLVVEMRVIAANSLEDNQNSPELQNYLFEGIEPVLANITQIGNEAEGIEFRLMSEGLGTYIKHVSIFDEQTYIFSPATKSKAPLIHILYKTGHYDLLYTPEQNLIDRYNQPKYIFDSYPQSEVELYPYGDKMYMTYEEFQEFNKPKELPDKTAEFLSSYCVELQQHLLQVYECLVSLNRQYKIKLNTVPELNNVIHYWTQYNQISTRAKEIRKPEVLNTVKENETRLLSFIQGKELSTLLFSKCCICNSNPIDFTLGCGHGGCQNDLITHILRETQDKVLFHRYEKAKKVVCPECKYIITDNEVQQILGEEILSFYKSEMIHRQHSFESSNHIQDCLLCHEVNHLENFPKNHMCFCYNCHGLMLSKFHNTCIFCNEDLNKDFIVDLSNRIYTCNACGDFMKLDELKDSLNCDDHLLCKPCILKSLQQKKCVKCSRKLKRKEVSRLNGVYFIVCKICGEGFEDDSIFKDKACDCVICVGCYSRSVEKGTSKCPICKTPYNIADITCSGCSAVFDTGELYRLDCNHNFCKSCMRSSLRSQMKDLKETLTCQTCQNPVDSNLLYELMSSRKITRYYNRIFDGPPSQPKKYECKICLEDYKIDDMRELTCNHMFCENCIRNHAEMMVKDNTIVNGVTCPQCSDIIDGIIIQSILPRELFDKYSLFIIRKNMKLARCPKCQSEFESDQRLANCINCHHSFCVKCSQKAHPGDCDESAIRRLVESFIEKGEKVTQCPGCKTPYTKDENCEHVTCQNPECGIDFCFRCAAKRSPILEHGNHYHRPACQDYGAYDGPDKIEPKCSECKSSGSLCARPADLPRIGLFF